MTQQQPTVLVAGEDEPTTGFIGHMLKAVATVVSASADDAVAGIMVHHPAVTIINPGTNTMLVEAIRFDGAGGVVVLTPHDSIFTWANQHNFAVVKKPFGLGDLMWAVVLNDPTYQIPLPTYGAQGTQLWLDLQVPVQVVLGQSYTRPGAPDELTVRRVKFADNHIGQAGVCRLSEPQLHAL